MAGEKCFVFSVRENPEIIFGVDDNRLAADKTALARGLDGFFVFLPFLAALHFHDLHGVVGLENLLSAIKDQSEPGREYLLIIAG